MKQFQRIVRTTPRRYALAVKSGLQKGGKLGVRLVKKEISALDVVATGELRNSVEFDKRAMVLGVAAPHGAFMEVGTRPHMPPVKPLMEWVKIKMSPNRKKPPGSSGKEKKSSKPKAKKPAKGNVPKQKRPKKAELTDKQALSIAWAIALTIKKKGTKPRFYMKKALDTLRPRIPPLIKAAMVKSDKRGFAKRKSA